MPEQFAQRLRLIDQERRRVGQAGKRYSLAETQQLADLGAQAAHLLEVAAATAIEDRQAAADRQELAIASLDAADAHLAKVLEVMEGVLLFLRSAELHEYGLHKS